jgi:hypothetical protein
MNSYADPGMAALARKTLFTFQSTSAGPLKTTKAPNRGFRLARR